MAALFTWNDSFLTRLPAVDDQHRRLVGLINDLGELVVSASVADRARIEEVRDGVLDYARVHFADEEALMAAARLDPRHVDLHLAAHRAFVGDATELAERSAGSDVAGTRALAEYLVHWLAYHILDVDQAMARQMAAVERGAGPAEAYEREAALKHAGTEPLLTALSGLFFAVSERNRELRALNQALEDRVAARTAELAAANVQLEALSTHDELTGLPNRRSAMASLARLWEERRRYGGALSLLMLDADGFKGVNDRFGHPQGDALLRELAGWLRQSVRASDLVCRLGGDEFVVICPRSSGSAAAIVAEKLVRTRQPFRTPEGEVCWSGALSIGAAEALDAMASGDDLLAAADRALYVAKRAGGGRAVRDGP